MLTLNIDIPEIQAELFELVRMFDSDSFLENIAIDFFYNKSPNAVTIIISGKVYTLEKPTFLETEHSFPRKYLVRICKLLLYITLSTHLKKDLPWGALTGIRPTKKVYEMLESGFSFKEVAEKLEDEYFLSSKKAQLAVEVVENQSDILPKKSDREQLFNLYVHIPFCPSRCNYCSFVSVPMSKQKKLVGNYVEQLVREIEFCKKLIAENKQDIFSIYIGGGTPTSLSDGEFEIILSAIGENFAKVEYTVEAGRPDTITKEKCNIMKKFGVTRISVNPQSLHNKTLESIGRDHTAEDFFNAYDLVKKYGFDINVDLIVGLENETQDDFLHTLNDVVKLNPENITIHTLCKKRGSKINSRFDILSYTTNVNASEMLNTAIEKLSQSDYSPYYLYRQKNALENLENIGFSKSNKQCINNITVMEEILSVIAAGAGAISKRIFRQDNRIERLANPKDVHCYLNRETEIITNKEKFFL